jgi:hypothetical protein
MPQIVRVSCSACDFATEKHIPLTLVVADDGTEHICGHPGEKREAERITKRQWRELRRDGRILHRYALLCLACGAVDHYQTARPRSPSRLGLTGYEARLRRLPVAELLREPLDHRA